MTSTAPLVTDPGNPPGIAATTGKIRIPPNAFGASFGLAGLAECWSNIADQGRVASVLPDVLLWLATVVWAVTVISYAASAARHASLASDLTDAVAGPFLPLAFIAPLLLVTLGLSDHSPDLARVLIDVLIAAVVLHGGWFTGQLFYGDYPLAKIHPGYFLPTVAGGLISSAAAASVDQTRLGQVMLGYGLICWAILGSLVFARLVTGHLLPDPLVPTLAIEVAPAPVATLAYFAIEGTRIDAFVAALAGYGVLMAIAQLRLVPTFMRLRFQAGMWAFTFAWAAAANVALYWVDLTSPAGETFWTWLIVVAITVLVGAIAVRSIVALVRGEYFARV
jgi:tellurite resistance protein